METDLVEKFATNLGFAGVLLIFIYRLPVIIQAYNDGKKEVASLIGEKLKPSVDAMTAAVMTFNQSLSRSQATDTRLEKVETTLTDLVRVVSTNQNELLKLFEKTNEAKHS